MGIKHTFGKLKRLPWKKIGRYTAAAVAGAVAPGAVPIIADIAATGDMPAAPASIIPVAASEAELYQRLLFAILTLALYHLNRRTGEQQ